ncbi:processed acidic surface protein [Peribacillus glennii]|uniref:Processed acidic surface protein n=1 Tax=Peribacillus glennii TaxID=2303991 RepID=A0A372LG34_9BACI|nr:processed acidic surface protein [Peribacillus glennii]RFU64922.1 processed acidic surface protein [Peribacillus glennii]
MKKITGSVLAFILFLSILPMTSFAAQDPTFDEDMEAYLKEISDIRGFEVTREDIDSVLANDYEQLEDYESVEELSVVLGDVIKADYSNLEDYLAEIDLTVEQAKNVLLENDDEIDHYIFVNDLLNSLMFYTSPEEEFDELFDEETMEELLTIFQEEFDITEKELENLANHFAAIEEELSTDEATAKFEKLAERMMAFEDFETLDELTPEQVSEIIAIYDELFAMLHMKLDFALVKDGKETPITLWDVLKMEELINAKLKVNIYDLAGNLLADLLITGEMVDGETVREIGQDLGTATEKVEKVVKEKTKVKSVKVQTEKGGKLPKTAGNYLMNGLIGLCMALSGIMLYRTYRRV